MSRRTAHGSASRSLRSRFFPTQLDQGLGPVLSFALRLLYAAAATALVVIVGGGAMLFNTAPQWISVVVEPLSLLLVPGLVAGMVESGPHSLDPSMIVDASVIFYFAVFFVFFEARAWRHRRRRRRAARGRS
jgi:cbb3-type cytochrome oxidase subunit 1